MDRRETLKTLLVGTVAGGALAAGCQTNTKEEQAVALNPADSYNYGRTPKEKTYDVQLMNENFFNEHEMLTIAVLCDIILPADELSGSATEAEVPAFIEFIVKDMNYHQLPMRGGLMWLDHESNKRFGKAFKDASSKQQIAIVDDIAWEKKAQPEMMQGAKFFDLIRNLTMTGFYTSKMGIETLGYAGNRPNVWDGVPKEELKRMGMEYDPDWIAKCIDQSTRDVVATWDEKGNLLT